jgi:hypothetical protein
MCFIQWYLFVYLFIYYTYTYKIVYDTKNVQTYILYKPEYKVFLPEITVQESTVHLKARPSAISQLHVRDTSFPSKY